MLLPTRVAVLRHIIHANYFTMQDKSYPTDCPELLLIEENGWNLLEYGCYIPVKCLALSAPEAVHELIKCGCKAGCKGRCSYSINSCLAHHSATAICSSYSGDCGNIVRDIQITDD